MEKITIRFLKYFYVVMQIIMTCEIMITAYIMTRDEFSYPWLDIIMALLAGICTVILIVLNYTCKKQNYILERPMVRIFQLLYGLWSIILMIYSIETIPLKGWYIAFQSLSSTILIIGITQYRLAQLNRAFHKIQNEEVK